MAVDAKSLTREELAAQFQQWEQPAYRVDQLLRLALRAPRDAWDAMTQPAEARCGSN